MFTSPSCRCCGCVVATEETPVEFCGGAWTPLGSPPIGYSTAGADAVIKSANFGKPGQPWKVSVRIDTSGTPTSDFQARVIGGMADCNNYCFFEYSPFVRRLVEVVDGVENELIRDPKGVGCPGFPSFWPDPFSATINIAWNGSDLIGWLGGLPSSPLGYYPFSPLGWGSGYGVGDLGGVDSIGFEDFSHEYAESYYKPNCELMPPSCCRGDVPISVLLEIGGAPSGTLVFGSIPAPVCTIPCSDLLGTFVLSKLPVNIVNNPDCYYQDCFWQFIDTFDTQCTYAGFDDFVDPRGFYFEVGIGVDVDGVRSIYVQVYTAVIAEPFQVILATVVTELACDDWTGWIDLDVPTGFGVPECNAGLTVRIKKA